MTDHTWSIGEEEKHYEQQRKLPQIQRITRENLMHTRRESMQQQPDMCLDADGPEEFPSGELETVTDEVTSVHPAYSEHFIFFCHYASLSLSLLDTLTRLKENKFTQTLVLSSFTRPHVVPV